MAQHVRLTVGTTDVSTLASVVSWDGALSAPTVRGGEGIPIAYKSGRLDTTTTIDTRTLTYGLIVMGSSVADFLEKWKALRNLFLPFDATDPNRVILPTLSLSQAVDYSSGTVTSTGTAKVQPGTLFPQTMPGQVNGRAVVELLVISGNLLYQ